jgi:hypothetical protein
MTDIILSVGSKDGLGKPVGFAEAAREFNAADCSGLLIVLPARAGEVAADNAFDRKHFGSLDHHAAPVQLREKGLEFAGKMCGIRGDEMVWNDGLEEVEPKEGELGKYPAFVWYAAAQNVVKGRDAVGGDEEEPLLREGVYVANLSTGGEGKGVEFGLEKGCMHLDDGITP